MTNEQIIAASTTAAHNAAPDLEAIATEAIKRYGVERVKLDQDDLVRFGLAMNEVQHQSFNLGVRIGMELVVNLFKAAEEKQ